MPSTVLDPTAQKIADKLTALNLTVSVKGYKWAPVELDAVPAGVVELPTLDRIEPDAKESQINATDWHIEYPVAIYHDLSEAVYSQAQAVETVEAFVKAIDADPQLAGTVLDAKVTQAYPEILEDEARPLVRYVCSVRVWQLV